MNKIEMQRKIDELEARIKLAQWLSYWNYPGFVKWALEGYTYEYLNNVMGGTIPPMDTEMMIDE